MQIQGININWLGHSGFNIENKIIIDPYKIAVPIRTDIILITHPHYDHCSLEDIENDKGYLLDGYPRNINQAKALGILLDSIDRPLQHTILIDVDPEVLTKRLSGRRTCSLTGKTLNIYFSSQEELDDCTNSGGELVQRDDDHIDSITKRIAVYKEQTEPMIQFYSEMGILKVIDGEGAVEEVYSRLLSQVN